MNTWFDPRPVMEGNYVLKSDRVVRLFFFFFFFLCNLKTFMALPLIINRYNNYDHLLQTKIQSHNYNASYNTKANYTANYN